MNLSSEKSGVVLAAQGELGTFALKQGVMKLGAKILSLAAESPTGNAELDWVELTPVTNKGNPGAK